MPQTVRIHLDCPRQAALVADFLMASDHDALWMITDRGPVVVTTAPASDAVDACNAVGV